MRARQGFTIIELLTVVIVIGILVTIGLPRLQATKERATVASMISDLRQMLTLQEAFAAENQDYAGGITPGPVVNGTGGAGQLSFIPSPGNVITLSRVSLSGEIGWRATARNPAVTTPSTDECGIYVGHPSFSPNAAVVSPGVVGCY